MQSYGLGSVNMGISETFGNMVAGRLGEDDTAVVLGYCESSKGMTALYTGNYAIGNSVNATGNGNCGSLGYNFENSTANSLGLGWGELDYLFTHTEANFYDSNILTSGTLGAGATTLSGALTMGGYNIADAGKITANSFITGGGSFNATTTNATTYLTTPTYDGSGQVVHPDIYYNPSGWNGYKYWMVMTPYPAGDPTYENPSILVSNDNITWIVPPGLTNPIDTPTSGQDADPDIILGLDGKLYVFFEWGSGGTSKVYVKSSSDGITWSAKTEILSSTTEENYLSPTVILDGSNYVIYYVDTLSSPNLLKRRTASTPTGTWSAATTCSIAGIPGGIELWHLNVIKNGDEYYAFHDLNDSKLYFAISQDGVNWTFSSTPILSPSTSGWDNSIIYRSAVVDEGSANTYGLWYSARDASLVWHIGYTTVVVTVNAGSGAITTAGILKAGVGTLTSLNLTADTNQIVLNSDAVGGIYTTLTGTATGTAKVITFPDITGTVALTTGVGGLSSYLQLAGGIMTGDILVSGTVNLGATGSRFTNIWGTTITGTSLTDGITTITGGNYTGVGDITGTDVDLTLGTGDISTTGTLGAGAITGTSGIFTGDLSAQNIVTTGVLGDEKLTNGTFTGNADNWTLGTGWNYVSNKVRKNEDGTGTLSQPLANMVTPIVVGEYYTLSYVISTYAVGTVTPTIAGVTLDTVGASGTHKQTFQALNTNDLTFTPTNDARFYIDTISLQKISGRIIGGSLWLDGVAGSTPTSGAGTRLMWIPSKPAFRAGVAVGAEWDTANIGANSFAFGNTVTASGSYSTAFGYQNTASGQYSTVFGYGGTTASGKASTAFGGASIASGDFSLSSGMYPTASGYASTAFGYYSVASGGYAIALGHRVTATGAGAVAFGYNENSAIPNVSFIAGTGTADVGFGQITIGYVSSGKTLKAEGSGSIAMGQDVNALTNPNILVFGKGLTVTTANSFNIGFGTDITTPDFQVTSGQTTITGNFTTTGTITGKQLATPVQSQTLGAGDTTFALTSNVVILTGDAGANTLATITGGVAGQLLTIICTDALVTITDTDAHTANTIDLSAAFTSADDKVLTLVFDGTSWYEAGTRSVNDLVFANDFRITEDYNNPQALVFKNQNGEEIMRLDEDGNLTIKGSLQESSQQNEFATGQAGIFDEFVQKVKSTLSSLGLAIENGIATLKEIIVDKLTTKVAKIEKLEMVDSATGEIWCTWVENGEWQKVKGECGVISSLPEPQPQPNPELQPQQPEPAAPEGNEPTVTSEGSPEELHPADSQSESQLEPVSTPEEPSPEPQPQPEPQPEPVFTPTEPNPEPQPEPPTSEPAEPQSIQQEPQVEPIQ